MAGTVQADPAEDAVAKLTELSRQAEQLTEAMHSAQIDLKNKIAAQAAAEKRHVDDTASADAAKAQLATYQGDVDKFAAAMYMGARTDGLNAILTADSPQGLIDKMAVQKVMSIQMAAQMQNFRRLNEEAAKAEAASAKSATDAKTAAEQAAAIRDELLVFMLAGHDTTATTLTYALWQLGRHRPIQDRVRAEVAALGHPNPTPEDVPRLTYTVQVLHEALRLCPPGAVISRTAVRDIEIDGYRVAAGTVLGFGIWAVQRDPALWPDPLRFDPNRFTPEQAKQRDRWQYLPFGAGPRSCIGDHFAMLEATLALATIIGRCQIGSLGDDFPFATFAMSC